MEFEDHEDGHEEEEEEEEEEMGLPPSYDSLANSSARLKLGGSGELVLSRNNSSNNNNSSSNKPRYRECLKNHAVGLGGHAVDGCGEFMPAGAEGTLDALKCAACNCHRNFHRKEDDSSPSSIFHHPPPQFSPFYRSPPAGYLHLAAAHHRPLALPSTSGGGRGEDHDEDVSNPNGGGGGGGGSSRKRFRTKFTAEQKEKMLELAEKLGWRIQKHDEAVVQQFCNETGVKRQVLKVWMHNNKHTLGKKP